MTKSNIFKILIVSFLISLMFFVFNPAVIKNGVMSGNLSGALTEHYKETLNFQNIRKEMVDVGQEIKASVVGKSFSDWGFRYLVKAPLIEEMVFRGVFVLLPALLLPLPKVFIKVNWVDVLLWVTMFIGSYLWATDHGYPHFPEFMVMWGGLINGGFIIYAPNTMPGKAIGMLIAIGLHALANFLYVVLFCLLF